MGCNENFGTGPKMERGSKFSLRNLARQGKSFPHGCFKMSDCGAASSDDKRALIEAVHTYLTDGRYPDRCGEPKKCTIRKKSKSFVIKDGVLFYKKRTKEGVS